VCTATVRPCPLGGKHYLTFEAAQADYETANVLFPVVKKETRVRSTVKLMGGGSYVGSEIPKETVQPFLKLMKLNVGEDFEEMVETKANRDRGYVYHMTLVSPPEYKGLGGSRKVPLDIELDEVTVKYKGLGRAVDDDNEAWFIVCESQEVDDWRDSKGLPKKDLHITLGFKNSDVHNQSKGIDSIVE
jgi:hypothetical protein